MLAKQDISPKPSKNPLSKCPDHTNQVAVRVAVKVMAYRKAASCPQTRFGGNPETNGISFRCSQKVPLRPKHIDNLSTLQSQSAASRKDVDNCDQKDKLKPSKGFHPGEMGVLGYG